MLTATIEKNVLTVKVDVEKTESKSGKSTIIASSHGNQATTVSVDGRPLVIGLHAYIKK